MSVPTEIYTIPSSSPVYNVTYVTQTANPDGTVTSNYTAGYLGTFILGAATGAILADGSGYWWPPYCNAGFYYPCPATYCGAYYGYGYHYGTPYYDYNTGDYGWHGYPRHFVAGLVAMFLLSVLVLLCYANANRIERLLCRSGTAIVTRLSAFILFAIGVQILWNGLSGGIPQIFTPAPH